MSTCATKTVPSALSGACSGLRCVHCMVPPAFLTAAFTYLQSGGAAGHQYLAVDELGVARAEHVVGRRDQFGATGHRIPEQRLEVPALKLLTSLPDPAMTSSLPLCSRVAWTALTRTSGGRLRTLQWPYSALYDCWFDRVLVVLIHPEGDRGGRVSLPGLRRRSQWRPRPSWPLASAAF